MLVVGGWNKNGIDVSDKTARARLCPMQPSQRDTNKRLENLDNEISSMEKSEVYQDRSRKLREGELFGPELRVHLAQEKSLSALKAQKEKIESFRDNKGPFLGQVFAASGFSTQKKQGGSDLTHRDWALIKMAPGRIGNNAVSRILSIYIGAH